MARSLLLLVRWLARNIRSIWVVGVGVEALAKGMILRIVGHGHEKVEKSPRKDVAASASSSREENVMVAAGLDRTQEGVLKPSRPGCNEVPS